MSLLSAGTFFFLILLLPVFSVSGVHKLTIIPDRGSTFNISRSLVKASDCTVCSWSGRSQRCSSSLLLTDNAPVSVEFRCSRPEDVFSVEIIRNIYCTTQSCSDDIIQVDFGSLSLLDFSRKYTWNLKASTTKAVQIDFTMIGLRQINPSSNCPDKHTYTLQAFETTRNVFVGKYCRMGPIRSAQVLNQGSFSLDVPAGQMLHTQFEVSIGEEIKTLTKIHLALPEGTSSSDLFSPNYPDSFPDDDVMEWEFRVPDKHSTSVQFLNLTVPHCRKKEAAVEYHGTGRGASVLRLTDTQPVQNQETFSLILRNCEMDRRKAGSPGLSLKMNVSAFRTSSPESCDVDMRRWKGLLIYIEKLRPASDCEMKINSVTQEKITVPSDRVTRLTFQGCSPEDVQVIARRVIACNQLKDCPYASFKLAMPVLPSCFPAPLSSVTWDLRPPLHGSVELRSTTGSIRQSLPEQLCNDSIIIKVAEDDGSSVGHFCPQGAIQKLEIHTNTSVTISGTEGRALRLSSQPLLAASFKEEITERYIFTVSLKKGAPVLLGTPGWPVGMKSYSTVSWIVSVPPKMEAHLMFANLKQPKCSNRHTNIRVQRLGALEEDYSRREDEEADSEITVSGTFYLNMSNCMPETGEFSAITKITLQKSQNLLLTVILSVVAVLVVIFVVVLAVVCVVIRKKKQQLSHQVSIYNPNGTSFRPGHSGFPAPQEDEYHVYASIEDTLVYTHLLRKGAEMGIYGEHDPYPSITGPPDSQRPPVSKDAQPDNQKVDIYQPFQNGPPLPSRPASHTKSMVENELYQGEKENTPELSPNALLGPRMEPDGGN